MNHFGLPAVMTLAGVVLSAVDPSHGFDFAPLINVGAIGVVLAWVLWKMEPRMRGAEASIDRLTRIIAVMLTELPHVIEAVRTQAKQMIDTLDDVERERDKKKP